MTTNQMTEVHQQPQLDLFGADQTKLVNQSPSGRCFYHPNANDIYLSGIPLKQHLEGIDAKAPFIISDLLDNQDWSIFEQAYSQSGRPPYAPRCMVGIILYAVLNGITSLRTIERMAKMDLGCMWVSGGVFPDHANIGRFINRHQEILNGDFFDDITRSILELTHSCTKSVAGDGTLIEAACSNYNLIKEEAAQEAVKNAQKRLQEDPENTALQTKLTHTQEVYDTLKERKQKQKKSREKRHRAQCYQSYRA